MGMNMKKIRGLSMILVVVMMVVTLGNTKEVEASSKYIKVEDYIKYIVDEMDWQVDKSKDSAYIEVAMDKGILKKGDFKDYSTYLTRTDAAVIANRLDELIHLKYGYPEDVYEFLKDCTLHEGKLYYTTDGSLYPKGATRETYPEGVFHEEVVMPILGEYFKDDNWKDTGLRTGYKHITDGKANVLKRYMEIGVRPKSKSNIVGIDPFDDSADIVKAWNTIKDGDRKINMVLEYRISDIKDIPKNKREDVASIVAKGIIKGYSNGLYVQNREFRGDKKITAKGAKNVIQMVLNPDTRALISPDGQLIRTKNLPKNASEYKYILESFPNEYYEMSYRFMYLDSYKEGRYYGQYAYPKELNYKVLYDNHYDFQFKLEMDKYELYDLAFSQVDKYLDYVINVDYRTVNDKWKEGLESSFTQGNFDWRISMWIDNYVEAMKKNRVIVECEHVAYDTGAIYECLDDLYVRVYVKYRVSADNVNIDHGKLIYGDTTHLKDLESGEWRSGIYDISVSTSYGNGGYQWGVSSLNSIRDGWNNVLY